MALPENSSSDSIPLFTPAMLSDPYAVYDKLRSIDPVHWHEPFGAWILTRYDDVVAAFQDPRLSSERAAPLEKLANDSGLASFFSYLASRMDFKDPPEHARLRGLVSKVFTPHVVEALRPRIQALVDQFLDHAAARGSMDVIADLAYPLPGAVISELLGVPLADFALLKSWSDTFVGFFKTVPSDTSREEYQRSLQAAQELGAYFRSVVAGKKGDDRRLLGALHGAELGSVGLTAEEFSSNATLLLHAGLETTTHLIGNGLLALLQNPDQLAALRTAPELIPSAVEECLRFDSPVQFTYRVASAEIELHGKKIRPGQIVHLILAAANRDPARFAEPNRFDIRRTPNKHVAFGYSYHFCLGAPLARLEAQIAFQTLLRRFPGLRLSSRKPEYRSNFVLRGLKSLPVLFG
jgi:cytochrome P450